MSEPKKHHARHHCQPAHLRMWKSSGVTRICVRVWCTTVGWQIDLGVYSNQYNAQINQLYIYIYPTITGGCFHAWPMCTMWHKTLLDRLAASAGLGPESLRFHWRICISISRQLMIGFAVWAKGAEADWLTIRKRKKTIRTPSTHCDNLKTHYKKKRKL